MVNFPKFPFDPNEMASMMQANMAGLMPQMPSMPGIAPTDLFAAQKKNMDALMAANTAAAEAYQELFKKQLAVFEETMQQAQAQATQFNPGNPQMSQQLAQKAVETALKNMTMLAEEARQANTKAFEIVQARIQESVADLKKATKG